MNSNIFQYIQTQFAHLADISERTFRDVDVFLRSMIMYFSLLYAAKLHFGGGTME